MQVAVKVDGTINKKEDKDKGWTAELAIPWADTIGQSKAKIQLPPKVGDKFRINLYRLDVPRGKPQIFSGWSAPLKGDLHVLDRFGELYFGDEAGKAPMPKEAPKKAAKIEPVKEKLPPNVVRMKPIKPMTLKDRIPVRIHPSKLPPMKKGK